MAARLVPQIRRSRSHILGRVEYMNANYCDRWSHNVGICLCLSCGRLFLLIRHTAPLRCSCYLHYCSHLLPLTKCCLSLTHSFESSAVKSVFGVDSILAENSTDLSSINLSWYRLWLGHKTLNAFEYEFRFAYSKLKYSGAFDWSEFTRNVYMYRIRSKYVSASLFALSPLLCRNFTNAIKLQKIKHVFTAYSNVATAASSGAIWRLIISRNSRI